MTTSVSLSEENYVRVKAFQKVLSENLSSLQKLFSKLSQRTPESENEIVLLDNFYLLQNKCKLLLKVDKNILLPKGEKGVPLLGALLFSLCEEEDGFPEEESIIRAINEVKTRRYVSNAELELLEFQFSCAAVNALANLFSESSSQSPTSLSAMQIVVLLNSLRSLNTDSINAKLNPLEEVFSNDPTGDYAEMNAPTKRLYRLLTSRIAQKRGDGELAAASGFIEQAKKENRHVGFCVFEEYKRLFPSISPRFYRLSLLLFSFAVSAVCALYSRVWWLAPVFPVTVYAAVKPLFDFFLLNGHEITYLPRLSNTSSGVLNSKTVIVLSTLLSDIESVDELKKRLEDIRLTNSEKNIFVCALCDLKHGKSDSLPDDSAIKSALENAVSALNNEYGNYFSAFVRKRVYSKTQGVFMGKERKRGAVEALMRFAGSLPDNSFSSVFGNSQSVIGADFFLALDFDTRPHMESAAGLVSIALHPLNRPVLSKSGKRIESGYGIISPRVVTTLKSSLRSPFTKAVGGTGSTTAYDTMSANLYQDVFSEGIFCGKGLIDVKCYLKCCKDVFPHEKILSHDILEGALLRTAYASDICFTETFPKTVSSYFKRLDRWIRGDIQNLPYAYGKSLELTTLDRYKLSDNARRAVTPIFQFFMLFLSFVLPSHAAKVLAAVFLSTFFLPPVFSFARSLIDSRFYSLSRRFYSPVISTTSEILFSASVQFILLPKYALASLRAVSVSLFRLLITKKNLLEWTTADHADRLSSSVNTNSLIWFIVHQALCLALIFSPFGLIRLIGLIFFISPAVLMYLAKPPGLVSPSQRLSAEDASSLTSQLAAMWKFYADFANAADNYLPPDNVQFAPVYRIAHRTSPTNIGLYLLSVLAAADFRLISHGAMLRRLNASVSTVERLEKYHGNLYNWYDTQTLSVCRPAYVSTVDSGNFVCCLTALKQGLSDYPETENMIKRLEKLISDTDLSILFDKSVGLFTIGINAETEKRDKNHYDLLMSEARMTSYFAVATHQVPVTHWNKLGRTMTRNGAFSGAVSYNGTMFEYFMPEILINSEQGSLIYESIAYCLHCQKRRADSVGKDKPYGVSESGYYAFDSALNYQYKAHGVQKTGLKRGLDSEFVISPYSTYLTLPIFTKTALKNLESIKKYCPLGKYGYYEAIDFSHGAKDGMIIKSYMAHHVGMSILSVANTLSDRIMSRRFMSDGKMAAARELIEEKPLLGSVIFEDVSRRSGINRENEEASEPDFFDVLSPVLPRVKLLSNGEYSLILTDVGSSFAVYREKDVYIRSTDLIRKPGGVFSAVLCGERVYPMTLLPSGKTNSPDYELGSEFGEDYCSYFLSSKDFTCGEKVRLHSSLPCEIRQFAFKNETSEELSLSLVNYLEPCMQRYTDSISHPAYNKLFISESYNFDHKCVIIKRLYKDSTSSECAAVGFFEDAELTVNLSREDVFKNQGEKFTDIKALFSSYANLKSTGKNYSSVPDPCVFIRTSVKLPARSSAELHMFIVIGANEEEALMRCEALRHSREPASSALLPIRNSSIEGRLASQLLPKLFFPIKDSSSHVSSALDNSLFISALWEQSVPTHLPAVLAEVTKPQDYTRISAYISAHRALRLCGVNFSLIFLYDDKGGYDRILYNDILHCLGGEIPNPELGIFLIDLSSEGLPHGFAELLKAWCSHVAPNGLIRIGTPIAPFEQIELLKVSPSAEDGLDLPEIKTAHGGFFNGRFERFDCFAVLSSPPSPWTHILSSVQFGTLVSSSSLGFTYAVNSRENKLTPWQNDPIYDNRGELLVLSSDSSYYDLVNGSAAYFYADKAVYCARGEGFSSRVEVSVAKKGMCKRISVLLKLLNAGENVRLAFYTEPVLGVDRSLARMIKPIASSDEKTSSLSFINYANTQVKGYMTISADKPELSLMTSRSDFWAGKWDSPEVSQNPDPCGALIYNIQGGNDGSEITLSFYISFGKTLESSLLMPSLFTPQNDSFFDCVVDCPDKNISSIASGWLEHQCLKGRIYARTGFYQNSGAFGFRDQLQDACGILDVYPKTAKRQIFRCCASQFSDGDVLHWWHSLPEKNKRGVRTKISDDLVFLPYAVCEYVEKTGDESLLDVKIPFCKGLTIPDGKHEIYGSVYPTEEKESVFSHCVRALKKAYNIGSRGLVLIGTGDWNDSFNLVGAEGRGESVWLSLFMSLVLDRFAKICENSNEKVLSAECSERSQSLLNAVSESSWDGEWYRRAYFDDSSPLGSKDCGECKIDSLSQSFAAFSRLSISEPERVSTALNSAYEKLFDSRHGITKLFTPPFTPKTSRVGYAAAYPKGIRENGGQYTHGAIWLGMALLEFKTERQGLEILSAISPLSKSLTDEASERYKNEPYYLSADIYTNPDCYGRGGWSLYTGSAGWYRRAVFEWLFGFKIRSKTLSFSPLFPPEWGEVKIKCRMFSTPLDITLSRPESGKKFILDNMTETDSVALDGKFHKITAVIPKNPQ